MGQWQKRDNGNYMGDADNHQKESPKSDNKSGSGVSKGGVILKGLPAHNSESSPKKGYEAPPNFQDMRNQDPKAGTI